MKNITVVGGGNSAHTLIPLLSKTGLKVNLLTRKPEKWNRTIELDYMKPTGELIQSWEGKLDFVTSKAQDVIPDSDIIILCMPVFAYRKVLGSIARHIKPDRKVYIGTVYGQGGFNWMTDEISQKYGLNNIVSFAIGLIPWICRTEKYGKKGIVYGAKPLNLAAVKPSGEFDRLNDILLNKISYEWFGHGKFEQAEHFISLTMSVDNQIIHTSRMFGLYKEHKGIWDKVSDIPYFYKDFSQDSADILKGLDGDYTKIKDAIKSKFPKRDFKWMLGYIEQDNITNDKRNTTVLETFTNSESLGAIKTPVVHEDGAWRLNKKHRFFYDDVFYGLCIAKWFAQKLGVITKNIDDVLRWAQEYLGETILKDGNLDINKQMDENKLKYGVPETYGFYTVAEAVD